VSYVLDAVQIGRVHATPRDDKLFKEMRHAFCPEGGQPHDISSNYFDVLSIFIFRGPST